ncbi:MULTISPECIES: M16 family metallopeptidase [unclassified Campylobacter]|uniref:M16 family metallopeptidase n=1 Tax=unclassified Campylobacter TaxID=2593542 RepID=UPI0022E9B888|nr:MULTISPECIES: M16 family metallopeptidase [unclassified Campylobacter]MDA3043636.1 insulinase family protein [Campylobacter sp. JMF_09 ED2]MDA3045376.1 insulinase family protein [Campylobacter sp. JMF_07 ED4]MDA3064598.1 insulinase family protein [Campylobacter sp. JMF_11 EL3]MDA3072573.1 insulinase family protein [Campylobacter sp. VBCF_03 NA9]MDA3075504.1 insulinase family protein [Campylobacter sp. JMF_05 ED3]
MKKIFFALCAAFSLNFAVSLDPNLALKFDANVTTGTLENGLKYFIQQNPVPKNSAYFYLNVNAGSIDENDDEQGFAHFVEHMAFNGSENFDKNELVKKLESLGVKFGADLNAQTSFQNTTYNIQASVSDENLNDIFTVFRDYAKGVKFDPAEVEKEKGVILEEAKKDYKTRFYEQRAKSLYPNSIFQRRFPIGKNEAIAGATSESLRAFYDRNYAPNLMSVIVVGDVNSTQIENLIKAKFSDLKPHGEKIARDTSLQKFGAGYANIVEPQIGTNAVNIVFAGEHSPLNSVGEMKKAWLDTYIAKLLSLSYDALNIGAKIPLKAGFDSDDLFGERRLYSFGANIFDFDANATLTSLFSAIKGAREHGFSAGDFESAKVEFINSVQTNLIKNDTQNKQIYEILDFVINGNTKLGKQDKHDLSLAILGEISLSDVNEYFKQITSGAHFTEIISTKDLNLSAEEIDKIYQNATPFDFSKNGLGDKKLLENEPSPAKFSQNFDSDKNITTLNFDNGVKAILKRNLGKKNSIQISVKKLGGISNFASKAEAEILSALLNSGTIGEFNEYEARRLTSGFNYSLRFGINELSSGFSGECASKDFEAMMRELFVKMSTPKIHANSLEKYQSSALSNLALRDETIDFRFNKQIVNSLFSGDLRFKTPLEIGDVKSANLAHFGGLADKIFANGGEYLFVISGDFDEDKITEILAKYAGNLKGKAGRGEIAQTKLSANAVKIEENYGDSDKSEVRMIYLNYDLSEFDILNSYKLKAFESAVKTQITEKIREAKGLIYSASVSASYAQFPQIKSGLNISFSCNEKDKEAVIEGIKEIIADIARNGTSADQLENFKKAQILSMKRASENNDFWLSNIASHELFGYPFYDDEIYATRINALSNDDVKFGANLIAKEPFIAILNPKSK